MQLARRHRIEFFLVAIGLTLSLGVACSSSKEASKSTPTTQSAASPTQAAAGPTQAGETEQIQTLKVEVKEWTIADEQGSSALRVKAGEVTIDVHNGGQVPHEVIVLKTNSDPANLPLTGDHVDEAASVGEVSDVAAGQTKAGTLPLQPGTYALICNLPGHYKQGMHALLTVE
jgi:uncharacterized cupredoxin-like copper-binding protein